MGEVINLNRFRKKKARAEKSRRAETNRRLHGRTKAERVQEAAEKARLEDRLNGAFLGKERVRFEDIPGVDVPGGELASAAELGDAGDQWEKWEAASERAVPLDKVRSLVREQDASKADDRETEE